MLDLPEKIAVVSGAGSIGPGWGNGKATAVLLGRQGAKVFAIDVNEEAARATCALIEEEGGECVAHRCDMTINSEVEAAMAACVERYGGIDILVNNVGGLRCRRSGFDERRSMGRAGRPESEDRFPRL